MSIIREEKETKIISIIGMEQCDIVYYLSDYGIKLNKRVLVIDNSFNNDFYEAFSTIEDGVFVEIENLMVVKDIRYSEDFYSKYDYVFIYHGMNFEKNSYKNSDHIYIVTDYLPANIRRISEMELDNEVIHNVIFRNKVLKKINEEYVIEKLHITPGEKYILPFYERDYELYMLLEYQSFRKLIGCSQELYDILLKLGSSIYGLEEKQMKKIMKK